jgi:cell division protein FtsI/penicillin-binding protein 2
MKKDYQLRAKWTSMIFAVIGVVIIAQMLRIQLSPQAQDFREQAEEFSGAFETLFPERGKIYDRHGYLLAGNQTVYEVGVDLREMENSHSIALAMSVLAGVDYDKLKADLDNPPAGLLYMVAEDYVSSETVKELQAYKEQLANEWVDSNSPSLQGLNFKAHLQRSYPEGMLASNVLGFVTLEGRGYFGVEEKYNDLLAGMPATVWVPSDPNRAGEMPKAPAGADLILTIDREVQAMIEKELDQALEETGSKNGTIIIMDPRTGEIIAMTSTPRLNLNQFWSYGETFDNAAEFNRAVAMQYEPGSVFKILTMAAALDSGTVAPSTSYLDTGFYQIGGWNIHNWDQGAWGPQDMIGCLEHSLNVCHAWVADEMGAEKFYTYLQRFGIGHPTGIDLSGEAAGRLKLPGDDDWYEVDLATNSFGQGVAVTPIQMMMAASALANDGKMVYPHMLYGMVSNGRQYNTPTQISGTPISPQTARTLSEMLAIALERGSSVARVDGYRIAGKTGTASIPGPNGLYLQDSTNTSFIGWGPVDDPQFMVYVWLEEPESSDWAAFVASPVFHDVVEKLVVLLEIPPDGVRQSLAGQ